MYTHYNGTIIMYARRSAPLGGGGGPVGVGWCVCDKTNHVHAHLVWFGGVCMVSVHYAQCFRHYRTWGVGSTATT